MSRDPMSQKAPAGLKESPSPVSIPPSIEKAWRPSTAAVPKAPALEPPPAAPPEILKGDLRNTEGGMAKIQLLVALLLLCLPALALAWLTDCYYVDGDTPCRKGEDRTDFTDYSKYPKQTKVKRYHCCWDDCDGPSPYKSPPASPAKKQQAGGGG